MYAFGFYKTQWTQVKYEFYMLNLIFQLDSTEDQFGMIQFGLDNLDWIPFGFKKYNIQ